MDARYGERLEALLVEAQVEPEVLERIPERLVEFVEPFTRSILQAIPVAQPGFRTKTIVIVTTLLDRLQTTPQDLADLYRARWNNELDLRSIKYTL